MPSQEGSVHKQVHEDPELLGNSFHLGDGRVLLSKAIPRRAGDYSGFLQCSVPGACQNTQNTNKVVIC